MSGGAKSADSAGRFDGAEATGPAAGGCTACSGRAWPGLAYLSNECGRSWQNEHHQRLTFWGQR